MKLKNPPEVMISKLNPNFVFFENARSSKIAISCYPCIKTSKSQPSKEVKKTQYAPFCSFESLLKFLAWIMFWDLSSEKDKPFLTECIENFLLLDNVNFWAFHFSENCKKERFWERFKGTKLYLGVFLYFFVVNKVFEKILKFGQKLPKLG